MSLAVVLNVSCCSLSKINKYDDDANDDDDDTMMISTSVFVYQTDDIQLLALLKQTVMKDLN